MKVKKIDSDIWLDDLFIEKLNAKSKYFVLYCLLNYEFDSENKTKFLRKKTCFETGISDIELELVLVTLENLKIIKLEKDVIYFLKFLNYLI